MNTSLLAQRLPQGTWKAFVKGSNEIKVPFHFETDQQGNITLINADDRILIQEYTSQGGNYHIPMHIFDADITAVLEGNALKGLWKKRSYGKETISTFEAILNGGKRFESHAATIPNVAGKWEVTFGEEKDHAMGIFEQKGNIIKGTFLTTTGDYRFLEGIAENDSMMLSCFDGTKAYLFKAHLSKDGSLQGDFWTATGYHTSWKAVLNPTFELPDAEKLTFLKDGYDKIAFSFPNIEDGKNISLEDEKFKGKIVIVQLLGSWCPNCMDETKFLSQFYNQNRKKYPNVEVIGIAYEQGEDFVYAQNRISILKKRFDIQYTIVYGGKADKNAAAASLPMLNHVMSYPTTIFIDKKGKVRKIHTGFSGPSTGHYYAQFIEDFDKFIQKLSQE